VTLFLLLCCSSLLLVLPVICNSSRDLLPIIVDWEIRQLRAARRFQQLLQQSPGQVD
jgi:hypothetical protein